MVAAIVTYVTDEEKQVTEKAGHHLGLLLVTVLFFIGSRLKKPMSNFVNDEGNVILAVYSTVTFIW